MASPSDDNGVVDGASDAISTLEHDITIGAASDALSSLTPSARPARNPTSRLLQSSDRSAQSKLTTMEFYDEVEGWGDYVGGIDAEGRRCGRGSMIWDNGDEYEGGWLDDRPHGEGTKAWPRGSWYRGGWIEGLRNGRGEMRYADGGRYKGGWRGGVQHGEGLWWSADGSAYEGRWDDGRGHLTPLPPAAPDAPEPSPSVEDASDQGPRLPISSLAISQPGLPPPHPADSAGRGRIGRKEFQDEGYWEGVYVGEMDAEGRRCGVGMMTQEDGTVYEGTWDADKPAGWGIYQFANGAEYEGEWEEGMPNGQGTQRLVNGEVLEGEWKDGIPKGRVKLRLPNGGVEFGGVIEISDRSWLSFWRYLCCCSGHQQHKMTTSICFYPLLAQYKVTKCATEK